MRWMLGLLLVVSCAPTGEWEEWLRMKQDRARKAEYFEQASAMIQRHGLFGLTMTYWQVVDLSPQPVRGD